MGAGPGSFGIRSAVSLGQRNPGLWGEQLGKTGHTERPCMNTVLGLGIRGSSGPDMWDPGFLQLPNLSSDHYRPVALNREKSMSFTVCRWPWGQVHGIFYTKIAQMLRISCRQGPRAAVAMVPFLVTREFMVTCLHSCSVHCDAQWLPHHAWNFHGLFSLGFLGA